MTPAMTAHARAKAPSYRILNNARQKAAETSGCDSAATRISLTEVTRRRSGDNPYEWQLDMSEAVLLGLDTIVIAGTGSGKTLPFVMPSMLDKKKKAIVISPLKTLEEDQAKRFMKLQVPAAAVNGDTWSALLQQQIMNSELQALLASPEMCLKHPKFCSMLADSLFKDVAAIIIDEAHCIGQWGGDFCKEYENLLKLCTFLPPHIPFITITATLTPAGLIVII
ncbi:hypothetical protein NLJ89_g9430 [Agrocybe chaxingu]|uniref:Helicase ATP-binding domain-containing protein n=1 Tax=Agrocybe chaxingu TaxID=84603 RepID=A0A9W8MR83_9AGAR|nr:hypothetical protein NLJ89_g9430 [Agrocybe chaxingu]